MMGRLKNQKMRTGMERLADWLLRANVQFGQSDRFIIPYDKGTLASWLGMTPEHLSRNLKALSDRGVVVHGREVTLTIRWDWRASRAPRMVPAKRNSDLG